jgi:hypothetical protein
MILCRNLDFCKLVFGIVVDLFRPRTAMEAEILVLRWQIIVLRRGGEGSLGWGAPRIHGELVKLGIDIGQTSVTKYTARRRGSPS